MINRYTNRIYAPRRRKFTACHVLAIMGVISLVMGGLPHV